MSRPDADLQAPLEPADDYAEPVSADDFDHDSWVNEREPMEDDHAE